jgi:hypothetical protein
MDEKRGPKERSSEDPAPPGRASPEGAERASGRRPDVGQDPTRKLLKVFGVKVTDYEERTKALLERYDATTDTTERAAIVREAVELTADLGHWLREVQAHVLGVQEEVLGKLSGK